MMRAADLSNVDAADVYKGANLAGTLTRTGDEVCFRYDSRYLATPGRADLAWSIPVASTVQTGTGSVPPFFAGLLPEGVRLSGVMAATKTSEDDHFTILLAVGSDTIGDVRVFPRGVDAESPGTALDPDLPIPNLRELFDAMAGPESADIDPTALPGVQGKVSARIYSSPISTKNGPAILKLSPPARFPRLVENEDYFMGAATFCGITTPRRQVVTDVNGVSGLLVERFDRRGCRRLAQEDACQINGLYPASKYRMKTETVFRSLSDAVERGGGSARLAVMDLFRLAVYSYAIGNGDLHGKNFSIQQNDRGMWTVTPGYDLLCTQPYAGWNDPMALDFYGRKNRWSRAHLVDSAQRLGLPHKAAEQVIDDVRSGVLRAVDDVGTIGFDDKSTGRLESMLVKRCAEIST